MEYLTKDIHRYAAKLIANDLVGNVYSAMNQAEKDLSEGGEPVYSKYSSYYIIHNSKWDNPYIIKKMDSSTGEPEVSNDRTVKKLKW